MVKMGANASKDSQRQAHFTFIWVIENGSELRLQEHLESPSFIALPIDNTKWKMMIKLLSLELAIQREDNEPESIEIEFELSFLSADGFPLRLQTSKKEFKVGDEDCLKLFEHQYEVFIEKKDEFLPNDTLTVRCRMWRTDMETSVADMCFARTRMGVDRRFTVWCIKEFSKLHALSSRHWTKEKTSHFVNPTSKGSPQFILSLFISEMNGEDYVNIQINQNSATKDVVFVCKFSLLDSDGRVAFFKKLNWAIFKPSQYVFTCKEIFKRNMLDNNTTSLLPGDVLTLKCEFQIEAEPLWSRIENYRHLNSKDLEMSIGDLPYLEEQNPTFVACCSFKNTFKDLYEYEGLCDVELRADDRTIFAHKNVLSVRSPVFNAMFAQDTGKKKQKIVEISDMNADTLERLVEYIYTDTVQDLQWTNAIDLYKAADKYELLDLRKKCSFFLKSNISSANVCSILSLANVYEDGDLRIASEYFISEYEYEILKTDEWKKFKTENVSLALEIAERLIHLKNGRDSRNYIRENKYLISLI